MGQTAAVLRDGGRFHFRSAGGPDASWWRQPLPRGRARGVVRLPSRM